MSKPFIRYSKRNSQLGVGMVLASAMMSLVLFIGAFVVDVQRINRTRQSLKVAADAMALAGASQLNPLEDLTKPDQVLRNWCRAKVAPFGYLAVNPPRGFERVFSQSEFSDCSGTVVCGGVNANNCLDVICKSADSLYTSGGTRRDNWERFATTSVKFNTNTGSGSNNWLTIEVQRLRADRSVILENCVSAVCPTPVNPACPCGDPNVYRTGCEPPSTKTLWNTSYPKPASLLPSTIAWLRDTPKGVMVTLTVDRVDTLLMGLFGFESTGGYSASSTAMLD